MAAIQQMIASYSGVPAVTYATWNPADKSSAISLSGGNLIAAVPASTAGLVRSTIGKSSGKWYWETVGIGGTGPIQGIAQTGTSVNNWPGADAYSVGYYGVDGRWYSNGTGYSASLTYTATDVIGIALDLTGPTLYFYKNNVLAQTISIGSSTYYAAVSQSGGSTNATATTNFGASAFTYSPPVGFNAGLYI